jgi:hypothetical protein
MDDNLTSYSSIRQAVLEAYYEGCRDMGSAGRPHAEALGYAEYQFENALNGAIANLMKDIVLLVLTGPWYPNIFETMSRGIRERLLDPELVAQLDALPARDREALAMDLSACGVMLRPG